MMNWINKDKIIHKYLIINQQESNHKNQIRGEKEIVLV